MKRPSPLKRVALQRTSQLRGARIASAASARKAIYRKWSKAKPKTDIQKLRTLMRQYILARDGFKCRKCGTGQVTGNRGTALQVAHIYPKGSYRSLEFIPENTLTLCLKDHLYWWHKHPVAAMEWAREHLGKAYLERLKVISQTQRRVDKAAMKVFFEQELAKMETGDHPELRAWRRP